MSVAHGDYFTWLPDTPYAMWVRDELADYLRLPDKTRVEVIGGDFVVSPGPSHAHNLVVTDIMAAFAHARQLDPAFPWRQVQTQDVDMAAIGDGFIPDLAVLDAERSAQLSAADDHLAHPEDLALVVEVTSRSTAFNDRAPGIPNNLRARKLTKTKWSGYARCGVPFYLLVDRDPRLASATLYFDPDPATGMYDQAVDWPFGETIELPEPFNVKISTGDWKPWS